MVSSLQILACETNLESSPSGEQRIALVHAACDVITTCRDPFDMRNSSNGMNTCYSPALALPISFDLLHVDCPRSRSHTDRVEGSNDMPPHIRRVIALHTVHIDTLARLSVSFSRCPEGEHSPHPCLFSRTKTFPTNTNTWGLRYHNPLLDPGGAPGNSLRIGY